MNKVAILIDGGYLLKRLPTVFPRADCHDPKAVAWAIRRLISSHLNQINKIESVPNARSLLYRSFFYDAKPYTGKAHRPISLKLVNYAKSNQAKFRLDLHDNLRSMAQMAVRLGEVRSEGGWILKQDTQKRLLKSEIDVKSLEDSNFIFGLKQKRWTCV